MSGVREVCGQAGVGKMGSEVGFLLRKEILFKQRFKIFIILDRLVSLPLCHSKAVLVRWLVPCRCQTWRIVNQRMGRKKAQ